ncbi:hypothetical protein GGI21_004802 [Coemansia aciculifera]|nr:hypothetical protein GGI21_004802 [Coemansia aciculifera]
MSSGPHFDYNSLLSGVSVGDSKSQVMATLSGCNVVDSGNQVTLSCPMGGNHYLYVKFDDNDCVTDKGTY